MDEMGKVISLMNEEAFRFANLQNLSMTWEKICFPLLKMELWTHWKFYTYHKIFALMKSDANTLTHSSPKCKYQLKQITISTKKVLQLKKVHSLKIGSEVLKPQIEHFMLNSAYFFYKMPTLRSSEVNKTILVQAKVVE